VHASPPSSDPAASRRRRLRTVPDVQAADLLQLAMLDDDEVGRLSAAARARRSERLNGLRDDPVVAQVVAVAAADPGELAMMTRPEVAELNPHARDLRRRRILAAHDTMWDLAEIAAYFGLAGKSTTSWRTRGLAGGSGSWIALPNPPSTHRPNPQGKASPVWSLPIVVTLAVQHLRADNVDLIPYRRDRRAAAVPGQRKPSA
jgi:hypothetical protein